MVRAAVRTKPLSNVLRNHFWWVGRTRTAWS